MCDVREYTTRTCRANLGGEPSRVVAQVSWRGGAYTLALFDVPAGAATGIVFFRAEEDGLARRLLAEQRESTFRGALLPVAAGQASNDAMEVAAKLRRIFKARFPNLI